MLVIQKRSCSSSFEICRPERTNQSHVPAHGRTKWTMFSLIIPWREHMDFVCSWSHLPRNWEIENHRFGPTVSSFFEICRKASGNVTNMIGEIVDFLPGIPCRSEHAVLVAVRSLSLSLSISLSLCVFLSLSLAQDYDDTRVWDGWRCHLALFRPGVCDGWLKAEG